MDGPPLTTDEQHHMAVYLLAPWLVGTFADLFMQGIICTQFVHYWTWYRDDILGLRLAVIGLMLLTTLKTIQCLAISWIMSVEHFTDIVGASFLMYTAWWQYSTPLTVAFIGIYVQAYFCYRLWVISKAWWIAAPVFAILLFGFLSAVVSTIYIPQADGPKITMWFACHLGTVFAGDVIMSTVTAYFLIRSKKNGLQQTASMIDSLIRLTFQTAAPAAICVMIDLILTQREAGRFAPVPLLADKLVATAFNTALPKFYAFSMMWTLNARRSIRANHTTQASSSYDKPTRSYDRPTRIRTQRDDVELGALKGIEVRTVQHVDFDGHTVSNDRKSQIEDDESLQHRKPNNYILQEKL